MKGKKLAEKIASLILDKKGMDVKILDISTLTSMTDFFILCTAETDVQSKAIAQHIANTLLEHHHVKPWHVEGTHSFRWVLLDFVDVVVHIFQPETRAFYDLERLWGDAKIVEVKDENETTSFYSE